MLFTKKQETQLKKAFAKVFCTTSEHVLLYESYHSSKEDTDNYQWHNVTARVDSALNRSFSLIVGLNISDKRAKLVI